MSSDSKHDQRLGEAGRPSEASEPTPTTTTGSAPATDAVPIGATGSQPQDAPSGDGSQAVPATGDGSAGGRTPSAAPEPAARPERRGSGALLWVLALLLLLGGGGAALWFTYLEPRLQQMTEAHQETGAAEVDVALTDLDARVTGIRQQLDGIEPRLDILERSLASLRQSVEKMGGGEGHANAAASAEALKEMSERMAVLENQAAAASGLAQQVRSLEAWTTIARDTASKVAANVLAVGQLVQAVDSGGAFVRPLAAVRALGGDDTEIAVAVAELEPSAVRGIPTLSELRGAFPATADAIVRAAPVTDGTGGWTDRVVEQLASLVSVRRTGPEAIANGGVDGAVATAQQALADGNLRAAVNALKGLEGPPAQAAQPWLERAEQRLAAEKALANLQQRAIGRLSAARG